MDINSICGKSGGGTDGGTEPVIEGVLFDGDLAAQLVGFLLLFLK